MSKSRVSVLLASGFEEIEAISIVDTLRRAEISVEIVGVGDQMIEGAHGISIQANMMLEDAIGADWDMIILPGGMPGATNLRDNAEVQALLKKQNAAGSLMGAICAAPIALAAAGVLTDKYATCYPGFEDQLADAKPSKERVIQDDNVITSQGPGTAIEFALKIVSTLKSEELAHKLRKEMLV